ncbi:hypothetical protein A4G19_08415 [Pasteurellaceae bacterium Macca]|nr:hypothetical protein [Pasteurellaceae bacterium Macca]
MTSQFKAIHISYTDATGTTLERVIDPIYSLNEKYLIGVCSLVNERRTFRTDRIGNDIVDISTGEVITKSEWFKQNNIVPYPFHLDISKPRTIISPYYNADNKQEICFTGFTKIQRDELEKLATENGFFVRKNVSQHLNYLVCGKTAGWKKQEEAIQKGSTLLTEKEFLDIVKS